MKQTVSAVIVAAGSSTRMGFDKLSAEINGKSVLRKSIEAFVSCPDITEIVLVYGKNEAFVRAQGACFAQRASIVFVAGGQTRAQSAAHGVKSASGDYVAVHDAARPFVSEAVLQSVLMAAVQHGAAAPAVPVKDTIKQSLAMGDGKTVPTDCMVATTPERNTLFAVQTPQCFLRQAYLAALSVITQKQLDALTDDCSLFEAVQHPVCLTQGDYANLKITTKEDLPPQAKAEEHKMRIGHGYDVHKLVEDRKLILGGVCIPYEKGLLGHSDADVLVHAIMDALLGAAALGDIGKHFPDTDAAYAGADSLKLATAVAQLIAQKGYVIGNIDATILCQKPKLLPHIPTMQQNIAAALNIAADQVNVKATTEENLGFTGQGQGIAAHAVALLVKSA
ncbi:MAG: 2-C-methyl-D-erythritol 2,4-cyclodiphosphate synthase [Faecalibacterium sp.]